MNGNNPYAGSPDVAEAGHRMGRDVPELTVTQRRALRESLTFIAARTRTYLPDEFLVGSEIAHGVNGPRATVAVQPPVGNPVSAGFEPQFDGVDDEEVIGVEERVEVARGLAASAALQVKRALERGDALPPAR